MVSPAVIWPAEHETALRALVLAGAGSHSIMAGLLNEQFGTSYSRNALIGKVSRMGLNLSTVPHPVKKKESKYRRHRKVAAAAKPKPQVSEVDLPTLRCVEVMPKNVALADLSDDGCHWPYGDGPFRFCDHPCFGESSYCGPHLALSIGRGTYEERSANRLPREMR